MVPSGSKDPEPFNPTIWLPLPSASEDVTSDPAFATGGWFAGGPELATGPRDRSTEKLPPLPLLGLPENG